MTAAHLCGLHWMQATGHEPKIDAAPGYELMASLARQTCATWNAHFPIGQAVRVYPIYGDESSAFDTVTTSESDLSGASAVVTVQGRAGLWHLTHVKPLIGRVSHPDGESAGVLTLKSAVVMVLLDQRGTPATAGKEQA
jgi:hypothetical protein